jgi:hypothetical protein
MTKIFSQPAGFEPARGNPIGFQVQRLNHSATTAHMKMEDNANFPLPYHNTRLNAITLGWKNDMQEDEKVLEMPGIEPGAFHMQKISQMRKKSSKCCGSVNFLSDSDPQISHSE